MVEGTVESWERQSGESVQAFEAFAVYRDLGPARSVTKVARELDKSRALVGRWSRQFAWVLRAAAYDREQDRLFLSEQAQARRDLARRHAKLAQAVQSKAVARLQMLDPRELSPSELLRYIQVAAEIERRAVGEAPEAGAVEDRDQGTDVAALSDEERRARMDQLRRELERRLSEGLSRGWAKRRIVEGLADPSVMSEEQLRAEVAALIRADELSARRWACEVPDCDGLPHAEWLHHHARAAQRQPLWLWTVWMLLTGRGWGKSRTAAEMVRQWAQTPGLQIAVVAKNATLVRDICFESPKSGLLSVFPPEEVAKYNSSLGETTLRLTNGTLIRGFGAETPDNLRGWAFDKAWCDEYAAWSRHTAQEVYDMLWFCLREADTPQVVISTTPKPLPHVKRLVERGRVQEKAHREGGAQPRVVLTRGHMRENDANLSAAAREELEQEYAGTRLGRQELSGELLEDVEGALWKGWMLEVEGFRPLPEHLPDLQRVVVAVDPATKSHENADMTAFTVAGRGFPVETMFGDDRPRGYLLHCEQDRYTPTQAMKRAAELYHEHRADCVVIEANNGGDYLPALLEQVDPTVNWRIVHATRGKRARAAPAAQLYEQARVSHVGPARLFAELEEQMTTFVGQGETEDSPDLLDSAVWALWDLFLDPTMPSPRGASDHRLDSRR